MRFHFPDSSLSYVCGDVFFSLHPMEEGEGENIECCCTPYFHEFIRREVLVLVMGSSCDIGSCNKAQLSGRMTNKLASGWSAHLISDRIRAGSCWKLCVPIILAASIEKGA